MSQSLLPRAVSRLAFRTYPIAPTRAIAAPCPQFLPHPPRSRPLPAAQTRPFTSSPCSQKKASRGGDKQPSSSSSSASTDSVDPSDFSDLKAEIRRAVSRLTEALSKLRASGIVGAEVVEELRVQLGTAGKSGDGRESVRLGDVAQVVPRGRVLNVICGEAEHIKPISTAIASSPHSLTPLNPEVSNPLTIQVPLSPPTGESRRAVLDKASQAGEQAERTIQRARQAHNQKLRKAGLVRSVRPDDLFKAEKQMEDVAKKGLEEVKKEAERGRKLLEA